MNGTAADGAAADGPAATAGRPDGDAAARSSTAAEPDDHPHPAVTPADILDIEDGAESVFIVGTQGAKVTKIGGLEPFAETLTSVTLRSNLISKMENISSLTKLVKLELYDNQVEALVAPELAPIGPRLVVLDMSFNLVRSMAPVALCPNLVELYIAQNRLRKIEGLEPLTQLQKLDLGANRIRVIEGLKTCGALTELWLGKNKIESLGDGSELAPLRALKRLDVQTNRLRALGDGEDGGSALHALTTLEELYLAHNAITQLGGAVRTLGALDTLDLTGNRLTSLDGSQHLTSLTEFWCSSNHIPTFEALAPASDALGATLSCIYLEHNPLAKEYDYRQRVAALFPGVTQIDATMVRRG